MSEPTLLEIIEDELERAGYKLGPASFVCGLAYGLWLGTGNAWALREENLRPMLRTIIPTRERVA